MALMNTFESSCLIQVALNFPFIISNDDHLPILSKQKVSDVSILFICIIWSIVQCLHKIGENLCSLASDYVHYSHIWFGGNAKMWKMLIVSYWDWSHVHEINAMSIDSCFIFEFKPMKSVLHSQKAQLINTNELMDWWLAFIVECLDANTSSQIPSFNEAYLICWY